jgi:hypothetical protein
LEIQPHADLDFPVSSSPRNLPEQRTGDAGVGPAQIVPVEEVHHLAAELEAVLLMDGEDLLKSQVLIDDAEAADLRVAWSRRPESERFGIRKERLVEVGIGRRVWR